VYMQRQRQETNRQAMERKRCVEYMKEAYNNDRHGKQRNKKASKQVRRLTIKKANKSWCPRVTNVGLDLISITSLC